MLAIHWYDDAIENLLDIVSYISERDTQAAQRMRDRIEVIAVMHSRQEYP